MRQSRAASARFRELVLAVRPKEVGRQHPTPNTRDGWEAPAHDAQLQQRLRDNPRQGQGWTPLVLLHQNRFIILELYLFI